MSPSSTFTLISPPARGLGLSLRGGGGGFHTANSFNAFNRSYLVSAILAADRRELGNRRATEADRISGFRPLRSSKLEAARELVSARWWLAITVRRESQHVAMGTIQTTHCRRWMWLAALLSCQPICEQGPEGQVGVGEDVLVRRRFGRA